MGVCMFVRIACMYKRYLFAISVSHMSVLFKMQRHFERS